MVEANQKRGEPSPLARLPGRLWQNRWPIGVAAFVLLVLTLAGTINGWVAALLVVAFSVVLAARQDGGAAEGRANAAPAIAVTLLDEAGIRRFADALPDPCFILDKRGIVRYANDKAAATFPIGAGEALTFRLRVPDIMAAFDSVVRGGPPVRVEFGERVPTERWFAAWLAPLEPMDGAGNAAVVLIIDDMSERRNADRVRVDFVANASHELRTPLASLAGFIETLRGPAREDAVARERFLTIMQEQAERMSRLVNDLLSLSRIEMKAHVRPSDPVDLVAVVRHVTDSLEPLAAELGVTIETEFPDRPITVQGDRDELIQVFENLVENAAKYGHNGKRVIVAVAAGDGAPQVTIRDFGPGIPDEHIPRLTERFYRVDIEASRKHRGTGLGLAIVKHILARHRARMTVTSRLGEGSAFTVVFPQAADLRVPDALEKA